MGVASIAAALALAGTCTAHDVAIRPATAAFLNGVAVSPAGDVWAVGSAAHGNEPGVALHLVGGRFVSVPVPRGTGELRRVVALSATNAYAVGIDGVLHWNGAKWQKTAVRGSYWGIGARGPDDVWTVGTGGGEGLAVEHWDGQRWNAVPFLPVPASHTTTAPHRVVVMFSYLEAVLPLGPDDVWVVGDDGTRALSAHWDGKTWTSYPVPIEDNDLGSLAVTSSGHVWTAGGVRGGGSAAEWDGSKWAARANRYWLPDVLARGDEVWTVLDDAVARWNGTKWMPLEKRHPNLAYKGLALAPNGNVWVAGFSLGDATRSVVRVFRCG